MLHNTTFQNKIGNHFEWQEYLASVILLRVFSTVYFAVMNNLRRQSLNPQKIRGN